MARRLDRANVDRLAVVAGCEKCGKVLLVVKMREHQAQPSTTETRIKQVGRAHLGDTGCDGCVQKTGWEIRAVTPQSEGV